MRYRALKKEFCDWMYAQSAWPKVSVIQRRVDGGSRTGTIVEMKKGAAVPEKCLLALIELLLEHHRPTLEAYLAEQGSPSSDTQSADVILERIAGPPGDKPMPPPDGEDWFLQGLNGLFDALEDFMFGKNLIPEGALCRTEDDVRYATEMMMKSLGRRTLRGRKPPNEEHLIRLAENYMKINQEEYVARDLKLWQAVPWTIVFAVIGKQRVGCTRILPLKKSAYEAFRDGERSVNFCAPDDLDFPSWYLLIENVGELPESEFPSAKRTRQLLRTICLQLARLSLFPHTDKTRKHKLHILSFAGTPTNRNRLMKFGFRSNGNRMAVNDVEMMELDRRKGFRLRLMVRLMRDRLRKHGSVD